MLLPLTVIVPTSVPPVHVVGAVDCGPITLIVSVPLTAGLVVPPESVEAIALVGTLVLVGLVAGAVTVSDVWFLTIVEVMPVPQVLVAALLFVSPL